MKRNLAVLAIVALACIAGCVPALSQSTTTVTAMSDSGSIDGVVSWGWSTDCNPQDDSESEVQITVGGYYSDQEIPNNNTSVNYGTVPQIFGPGSYTVSASWGGFTNGQDQMGDPCNVSGSSGSATATVAGPVASSVAIVLASSAVREGQPVTITVDVTGANGYNNGPTPTGSVALFYKSSALASGDLSSVSSANGAITGGAMFTLSSSGVPPGTYALTAVYNGDSNLTGSSSSPVSLTITKSQVSTVTSLSVSSTTLTAGQSATLTATVTPSVSGITPTGTVTFMVGTSSIGTAKLNSSGVATLTE